MSIKVVKANFEEDRVNIFNLVNDCYKVRRICFV